MSDTATVSDRFLIRLADLPPEAAVWRPSLEVTRVEAIVAAAGRGTRLGFDKPKVLFPVNGRPILQHLAERLDRLVCRINLVLSPSGLAVFQASGLVFDDPPVRPILQPEPTGMADAVSAALQADEADAADIVIVVWGDQVGLRQDTIARALFVHQHHPRHPALTFPVAEVTAPYVHYLLDAHARVVAVHQKREGDPMPLSGLADCGCFVAARAELTSALQSMRADGRLTGRVTGERNFLPVVAALGATGQVVAVHCASAEDTLGINRPEDALTLERDIPH